MRLTLLTIGIRAPTANYTCKVNGPHHHMEKSKNIIKGNSKHDL